MTDRNEIETLVATLDANGYPCTLNLGDDDRPHSVTVRRNEQSRLMDLLSFAEWARPIQIAICREAHANVQKIQGDRIAVIVLQFVSKRRSILGVQFWTQEMIHKGVNLNSDRTESQFVELL